MASDFSESGYSWIFISETLAVRKVNTRVNKEDVRDYLVIPYVKDTSGKTLGIVK